MCRVYDEPFSTLPLMYALNSVSKPCVAQWPQSSNEYSVRVPEKVPE